MTVFFVSLFDLTWRYFRWLYLIWWFFVEISWCVFISRHFLKVDLICFNVFFASWYNLTVLFEFVWFYMTEFFSECIWFDLMLSLLRLDLLCIFFCELIPFDDTVLRVDLIWHYFLRDNFIWTDAATFCELNRFSLTFFFKLIWFYLIVLFSSWFYLFEQYLILFASWFFLILRFFRIDLFWCNVFFCQEIWLTFRVFFLQVYFVWFDGVSRVDLIWFNVLFYDLIWFLIFWEDLIWSYSAFCELILFDFFCKLI